MNEFEEESEKKVRESIARTLRTVAQSIESPTSSHLGAIGVEFASHLTALLTVLVDGSLQVGFVSALHRRKNLPNAIEGGFVNIDSTCGEIFELVGRIHAAQIRFISIADEEKEDNHVGHGCPDDPLMNGKPQTSKDN